MLVGGRLFVCWQVMQGALGEAGFASFRVWGVREGARRSLARVNWREVYHLLFQAAAATLKVCGRKYLGGEIGVTAVLHILRLTLHCVRGFGSGQAVTRPPHYLMPGL